MQRAYTSTVMGPAYLAAGVLGAAAFGAVTATAGGRHTAVACLAFAKGSAGWNPARAIEAAITGPVTMCGDRA